MKLPITLDLTKLTQKDVDEALPYAGKCEYQTCIIGRLMTPEERNYCDGHSFEAPKGFAEDVEVLTLQNVIEFLNDEQYQAARQIQNEFDENLIDDFKESVAKWVKA